MIEDIQSSTIITLEVKRLFN